ncbi:hypothetical protein BDFB_002889 [Asbolus verrucosus]|uniref:Peptidase S8 pro-domain domain-containing protein n=1 Tax=Asbolus verrucosus TaxID=1661398 RepID=A0A482W6E9_ASBVE|nr:hypothetical protein BDFB_002889 [Asbolus verrucosus]
MYLLVFRVYVCVIIVNLSEAHYTQQWAVHIEGGPQVADEVARDHGFDNQGQVSEVIFVIEEKSESVILEHLWKISRQCSFLSLKETQARVIIYFYAMGSAFLLERVFDGIPWMKVDRSCILVNMYFT